MDSQDTVVELHCLRRHKGGKMASKTFENFITLTQYFDNEDDTLENIEL
jgi:hypothetical protein